MRAGLLSLGSAPHWPEKDTVRGGLLHACACHWPCNCRDRVRGERWPTKGGKVQTVPIVDPAFWNDLERHILDSGAQSNDYLLCRRSVRPNRHKPGERFIREYRDEPMGVHGLHKWWYACLERAGVVASGQTSGERMHKRGTRPASGCSTRPRAT